MKKTWCYILSVMLLLIFSCNIAIADNVRTSGLYTYSIKGNGTIVITGFNWESNNGDIYIPSMIDGYTVTGIGAEAFRNQGISSKDTVIVVIPDTITSIESLAFFHAPISTINIPDSVQYIGQGAFADCPLTQFAISPNQSSFAVIENVLYNKSSRTALAFAKAGGTTPTVPEGIVEIGDYAFYGSNLYNEGDAEGNYSVIPGSVNRIGKYAFAKSSFSIRWHGSYGIRIKSAVIDEHAFESTNFSGGYLKIDADTIGDYAFYNIKRSNGYDIAIDEQVQSIGDYAFAQEKSVYMTIAMSKRAAVNDIGKYAFQNVGSLNNEYAFRGDEYDIYLIADKEFNSFFVPQNIKVIKEGTFSNSGIMPVILPEGLVSIEDNAFIGCDNLNEITLPSSITTIGNNPFERTKVTLIVEQGTYSALWASENGYNYKYAGGSNNNLDWLNPDNANGSLESQTELISEDSSNQDTLSKAEKTTADSSIWYDDWLSEDKEAFFMEAMGIVFSDASNLSDYSGGKVPNGALVANVLFDIGEYSAGKGGIKAGDIIVEIDGKIVSDPLAFYDYVYSGCDRKIKVFRPDEFSLEPLSFSDNGEYIDLNMNWN